MFIKKVTLLLQGKMIMRFQRPKNLSYSETIRFHGHNGPFLALGYKLGRFLNKKLKPKGIMDFRITVKTKNKKPFTCLIDGLQCSTFTTLGKGNMIVKKNKGRDITIIVEKDARRYAYAITKRAMEICLGAVDLDKAARKIFRTPGKKLWKRSEPLL